MRKHKWASGVLEEADVTRREGYPCEQCPKDGLISCQWRKCRDFQAFFRPAWRCAVAPLTPSKKAAKTGKPDDQVRMV